ncbi:hypothetical protein MMC14_006860 [Varicellaria rhodocarpa]|nr:hypothetical protein [Varicellaria rhodocarpa]
MPTPIPTPKPVLLIDLIGEICGIVVEIVDEDDTVIRDVVITTDDTVIEEVAEDVVAEDVAEAAVVQDELLEDGSAEAVEVKDEEVLGSIRNAP